MSIIFKKTALLASGFQEALRTICLEGFKPTPLIELSQGYVSYFKNVSNAEGPSLTILKKANELKKYLDQFEPDLLAECKTSHSRQKIDHMPYLYSAFETSLPTIKFFLILGGDYKFSREVSLFIIQ